MKNNGLNFEKREGYSNYWTTISIEADAGDVYELISTLLQYLHSADEGLVDNADRFRICQLIKALLPSMEQMQLLQDTQIEISENT